MQSEHCSCFLSRWDQSLLVSESCPSRQVLNNHLSNFEDHFVSPYSFGKFSPCVLLYVDNLCIAAESPSGIVDIFKTKYHLKVKGDGKLSYHLGADYFEDQMELLLANLRSTWIS